MQEVGGGPADVAGRVGVDGEMTPKVGGGVGGGAGGVLVDRLPLFGGQSRPVERGGIRGPAAAQSGHGEVLGQATSAVPEWLSVRADMIGEGEGIAGDLAGVERAVAETDEHPGSMQVVEEFLDAPGLRRRSAGHGPQDGPDGPGGQVPSGYRAVVRGLRTGAPTAGRTGGPASAEFGQGQVGSELSTAIPDGLSCLVDVAGQGDRIADPMVRIVAACTWRRSTMRAGSAWP